MRNTGCVQHPATQATAPEFLLIPFCRNMEFREAPASLSADNENDLACHSTPSRICSTSHTVRPFHSSRVSFPNYTPAWHVSHVRNAPPKGFRPGDGSGIKAYGSDQPCLCLCFGFSQITRITPLRRMTLHFSHMGLTDALTFTMHAPFLKI